MPRQPRPRRVVITEYTLDGRVVPKGTRGAVKSRRLSATWYGMVGGQLVSLETTDEGEAWTVLRRKLRELADARIGIVSPVRSLEARPLVEHLDDWCAALRARGTSEEQARQIRGRLLRLFPLSGWTVARDLTDDSLSRGLSRLGLAAQTRNHYRSHARSFAAWLGKRLGRTLLAGDVPPVAVGPDRRYVRRLPTDDEVGRLLTYLERGDLVTRRQQSRGDPPIRRGLTGRGRALGYRLVMATGLRADELRSLDRDSFDLGAGTVKLHAREEKNRKGTMFHLPAWLVSRLREYFAAGGRTWAISEGHLGRVLRADLRAAGVERVTRAGHFDMHSLRIWYIQKAAESPDIDPKTLMEAARHSDPRLTLQVYARARDERLKRLAEGLRQPGSDNDSGNEKTGKS